jgi:probable HAF family extracellular repeat protein
VASEAYGVNNNRVVVGLLYDTEGTTFPFRWEDGRMTVLKGPNGRRREALLPGDRPNYRNLINDRGQMLLEPKIGDRPAWMKVRILVISS